MTVPPDGLKYEGMIKNLGEENGGDGAEARSGLGNRNRQEAAGHIVRSVTPAMTVTCPLCLLPGPADRSGKVAGADDRDYCKCDNCSLIFADPRHYLSAEDARARYATHQNSIDNLGYVKFLNRLLIPMRSFLDSSMRGLDYGCGPGPTISGLLQRQGMACDDFDPLFFDQPLHPPYDYIVCTECFEHFQRPDRDIARIVELLKPGGKLGIMTELWQDPDQFKTWYYTRDPTHVCFFHQQTIHYLARRYRLSILWQDRHRVVIFHRQ